MELAVHTNAFRDMEFDRAAATIRKHWPEVGIEASTCREHLYETIIDTKMSWPKKPDGVVALSGGWCDFPRGEGLQYLESFFNQAALATQWGVPLRLFFSNPTDEVEITAKNFFYGISNLSLSLNRYLSNGIPVCIENHGGLTSSPHLMDLMLDGVKKSVDHGVIGTTFDPANYLRCGEDAMGALTVLDPKDILHVHAKDIDDRNNFCAVGDGRMCMDWPLIIDYLKTIGYNGVVTVEYEGHDMANRVWHITNSLNFLRKIIDE